MKRIPETLQRFELKWLKLIGWFGKSENDPFWYITNTDGYRLEQVFGIIRVKDIGPDSNLILWYFYIGPFVLIWSRNK